MLAAGRKLVEGDRYARGPDFLRYDPSYMLGREVHGATLGIVGLGRIGEQVARRARGFDMTVLYHNRRRREDVERTFTPSIRFVEKDDLLARSDYVMLSVPLTDETRGYIGTPELDLMKPDATLSDPLAGSAHWVWNEGVPADIPPFEGTRVVLLGPPPYDRSWNCVRKFPDMTGALHLEHILSADETRDFLARIAAATTAE